MLRNLRSRFPAASAGALIAACATSACAQAPDAPAAPMIPAALQAPAGEEVFLQALATGVQIYDCQSKPEGGHAWTFIAPEAALVDGTGRSLGKHYAGPTWQYTDGSTVVGRVMAQDAGPDPSAIPWLLLAAKSNAGPGLFSTVTHVQRVATVGGIAPAEPCGAADQKRTARVPYSASYYFYRAAK